MRALIVDDERLARVELRRLLAGHPAVEIVGEASHVADALAKIRELTPDLLFLDVAMPGGTGFDLLAALDASPAVIFTTAFDAHAVRAFEVSALDYLVKPIDPGRLASAIERALRAFRPAEPIDRVFVRDGERCWFVRLREVGVIEAEGNYARLDVVGHPLLARSLGYLEARLGAGFFRTSRRHLVNLALVERVEVGPSGGLVLVMAGGREIEMSRRAAQRFRARTSI